MRSAEVRGAEEELESTSQDGRKQALLPDVRTDDEYKYLFPLLQ
jgi:hypothetical protein